MMILYVFLAIFLVFYSFMQARMIWYHQGDSSLRLFVGSLSFALGLAAALAAWDAFNV